MRKTLTKLCLSLGLALAGSAQAAVDLSTLDDGMAGPRTKVLVLGSVHLLELQEDFDPATLDPLLDRLAAYKPDIITIESIPGESCDLMARHPAVYDPEGIAPYCTVPDAARAATGLDVPAAIAEVKRTLSDWPAEPRDDQRRHLAALFLAAGDNASALTQWLQLPETARHAGDGLDEALVAQLERAMGQHSESYRIAARLAARLGLQRVYPADDHTGDSYDIPGNDIQAYATAIRQAWDADAALQEPLHRRKQAFIERADMLGLYRYINSPDHLVDQINSDLGAAMRHASPQQYGRMYVGGWETRNLRMVANIRATFITRPGARVLSIVGATHKPWFDSLLGQMQGVEIVDAQDVLGPAAD
ncbi:DUF5694 domain-containing protein [Lysobacter zhanggongensis]|uniref:DUF5694 domain-containing protein n=1 Tax=Lysobacter zhanggongensis TaxID=1774951 RepID=A0ABU7YNP2_9GAMM